ncbi:DinB family protein [Tenggerimyces flavus]|uniref:DinB family protein n=1 Tax=Tenggerimyces flavus TaxID=1708749 RepID=A0ABV7YJS6_9ACTN|nr:DinB family protein [Tenggerimyces flavus]MBM7784023.1 hypothetical protein [Tenggerimyces flavus]
MSPDDRPRPPRVGDERTTLDGFLDFHRATLLWKCEGLTDEQLKLRAVPPSDLSLLGLVRHVTEVERGWFLWFAEGEQPAEIYCTEEQPDGDLVLTDADPAADLARYEAEIGTIRARLAGLSLDDVRDGVGLRWLYGHLIEEYARHNGHADLLREVIDGSTGE